MCVLGVPSPRIYRREREGGSLRRAQVGGILLGPLVQFAPPPLPYFDKGGRKEGGGEGSRSHTS